MKRNISQRVTESSNASISYRLGSGSSSFLRSRSLSPSLRSISPTTGYKPTSPSLSLSPLELSRHLERLSILPPPPSAQGFPERTFFHVCSPPPPALYTNLLPSDSFRMDIPRITHARPSSYDSMNNLILSHRSCFDVFPPIIPSLALSEPEPPVATHEYPPVIHIPAAEEDPDFVHQYELAAALLSRGNTHRKCAKAKRSREKKEYIKSSLSHELE
ncbi:uncharacterized protein BT62DRAFT_935353 [Guyanagaster necrorhizus]|uniref:Uncharacterized protein n=1 Tax=Guyanagaster necrorhizus TaxID=856835 RepID=A0A9P8AQN0_9AGAR|nr:uncharacterized protein BT62DRAFT_935353 [Guyanagaster necrorhizus MCA 3950]KAG7443032.1 hypothetical protein BT62DRAFT_935353 [Guyanagaster necrorhizus MCA 3950]